MKLKTIKNFMTIAALFVLVPITSLLAQTSTEITEQETNEIAIEAYIYFHPLLTMDVTRRAVTNVPEGAVNSFNHFRKFPEAEDRAGGQMYLQQPVSEPVVQKQETMH